MYNIIKDVIAKGSFKLTEIQQKVKKLYLLGDITETQMDELLARASGSVSADAERPEFLVLIQNLAEEVGALSDRVKALEGGEAETETVGYPEWKIWNGISMDYQCGAIVVHNGELWESVFGGQNVWEPGTVDEGFWKKVNTDN